MDAARILIVDDDAILATRLEETLVQLGYQPTGMAATGEAAVEMALTQMPDAILMDIRLRGEMTGIQAAEEIHQKADIPIIYLTAYTEENLVQQANLTDAYAFLAKPVRDRELRASLEMALYKHATEKRLKHLNQVLRAVRDINQLITHEHDAQRLLEEVCQILVRTRGYLMVWIGKTMPEDTLVHIVARAGEQAGFLDQVKITWEDLPNGQGSTSIAVREQRPVVCHDLAGDPHLTPWREVALQRGLASSAAIPILHEQRFLCVLSVYGDRTDLFGDEEVDLLDEVARDLAFALIALEEEAARKRAEAEIQRLASFPQLNPNPILEVDGKGEVTYQNQAIVSFLEKSGHLTDPGVLLPQDMPDILGRLARGESALEYREVEVDGRVLGEDIQLLPQFSVARIYARDITEPKQAKQKLLESEQKFRNVFDNSAIGKSITSLDGKVNVNRAFCDMLGYSLEEMSQIRWQEVTHPDDIELTQNYMGEMISGEQNTARFIKRYLKKDGSILWADVHSRLQRDQAGAPQYYITAIMDITERKLAESALLESEKRYHELFDQMLAAFALHEIICDENNRPVDYRFLDLNPSFEAMTGLRRDDLLGKTVREVLPETEAYWIETYGQVALTGESIHFVQYARALGKYFEVSAFSPKRGQFAVTFMDITEQRKAEQSLQESEERFKAIAINTPDHILIQDRQLRYRFVANPQLGLTEEDMLGKTDYDFLSKAEAEELTRVKTQVLENGQPVHFETSLISKAGEAEFFDGSYIPRFDAQGQVDGVIGYFRNITERKQTEEELREQRDQLVKFSSQVPGMLYRFMMRLDGTYCVPYTSEAIRDIFGCSPEEVREDFYPIARVILPEDLPVVINSIEDSAKHLSSWQCEYRVQIPGQAIHWVWGRSLPEKQPDGSIVWYGFNTDISERKFAEQALIARLELREYAITHTFEELFQRTLDLAEQLTSSSIGFFHTLDPDQKTLTLQMWSTHTLANMCTAVGAGSHYPIQQAGVWVDCIRQRRPVIHNDYASLPERKGLPEGHAPVIRELVVPIFHDHLIVAVLGVGNKPLDYTETDIRTITELANLAWDVISAKRAGEALQSSEQQYRTTLDSMGMAIHLIDEDYRIVLMNRVFEQWNQTLGLETAVAGQNLFSVFPFLSQKVRDEYHHVLTSGEILITEETNRFGEEGITTVTSKIPILEHGKVIRVVTVVEDISERKRAEQSLRESEERFRNIFEGVQDAIFVESPDGGILDVNQCACEMFGYNRAEFLTKTVPDLVPPGSMAVIADENQPDKTPDHPVETLNVRSNGEIFPVELSYRLQEISGKPALLVVLREITERKRAEQALRNALRDKEVLLRELYHRTKNNMQVISALLNMEADRSGDTALQKTLRDMDTRILSMALVHEQLYQSKNLARIDLKDYITNLAALIMESYDVRPDKVRLLIDSESITVPIESAIPCGLLVNEIISNSLKHAFPGERMGEVKIRLTRLEESQVVLEISDNGAGVPEGMDLPSMKSLGMRIIFGIAGHQLHAQVQVETSHGVGWRICFPNLANPEPSIYLPLIRR